MMMFKNYCKYLCLLLLITICGKGFSQDAISVNGIVLNERSEPLSGISLSIEGILTDPVITDSTGTFVISSPSVFQWLIITASGDYKSKRIYLNGKKQLIIRLATTDLGSTEDVSSGVFYREAKRNTVSSAQELGLSNFYKIPGQTVGESFQGNVAGIFGTHFSGMPGSGMVNYLRGIKSMNTNNQPLYIIDGMPLEAPGIFSSLVEGTVYNPLSFLDPKDITSINVLKDYAVGSAYGMRGSNGVIMIETLKPTELKTIIDFTARTGITFAPKQIPQLNGSQFKSLANEVLMSSGQFEENYPESYPGLYSIEGTPGHIKYNHNTNWQDEIFRNSAFSDYYLRILGGDQIARYGLSVGYLNHEGILGNTAYNRFNIRFVGTFSLFKWLRFYVSSNLSKTDSYLKESAKAKQTSPILNALSKNPLMIPFKFDNDGNQLKTYQEVDELGISNPVVIINKFSAKNNNYRFLTSFRMEADVTKYLKLNSLLGVNMNSLDEIIFQPNHGMELYYDGEVYNVSKSLKDYCYSVYSDNNLAYKREFSSEHQLSAIGGFRINTNKFEEDWGIGKNANKNDEYTTLQSGTDYLRELGGDAAKWNRLGVYTRLNYIFRDRYLLHAGMVSEMSSRVGKNAKANGDFNDIIQVGDVPFGLFYSLGGAWRISSEPFLNNHSWIEDIKIRINWGTAGNDDIGNQAGLRYYQIQPYRESSGVIPGNLSDKTLRFESSSQLNPGLDISLFANRVSLTLDYFAGVTNNMLVLEPQTFYTGYEFEAKNSGTVSNKGWEINVFSRIISQNKFKLDVGMNLSGFKNEVVKINNDEIITGFEGGEFISRKGESLLNFYGYKFEGVISSKAQAEGLNLVNGTGVPFGPGDALFKDISGPNNKPDGVIDLFDKTIIGSPVPKLFGSAYTTIYFYRWSLNASIQFVKGNEVYNYLRSQNEKMSDLSNQSINTLKRWQYDNHETDIPRASWNDPAGNAAFSSRWIEDGSYLRLKNITLSYSIPEKFMAFNSAEFFVTGYNLLTLTRYLGYDPEFANSYKTMDQGIDYGLMPNTRKIMIGIKIGL